MADFLKKSSEISVKARQDGNQIYTSEAIHNEVLHKAILWNYSKSIAFAPVNSEDLALGYSSRSIFLIHIYRFQECLSDIEKAFSLTTSVELKAKLQTRKKTCMSLMHVESLKKKTLSNTPTRHCDDKDRSLSELKNDVPLELPKFTPSKALHNASESVALKYDETFGRHFVATRDIQPGEIIIVEDSYVCFPKNNQRYTTCSHCLQFSWNGIPCENCPIVMYCSESCKKEARKSYHDIECLILPYLPNMHSDNKDCLDDVIIAFRLFIKAVKKEGLDSVLNEADAIDRAKGNSTFF